MLNIPHVFALPRVSRPLVIGIPDPADRSRRVTVNLAPAAPRAPSGRHPERKLETVARDLDALLATLAADCDLRVIADGYLRAPRKLPANLRAEGVPLNHLLLRMARTWGCDWRYLDREERTVLFRARGWWLEDEANIPQEHLAELERHLGPDRVPALEGLLLAAELTGAQAHHLADSGRCPGMQGVSEEIFDDGTGARPCLRFFARLPAPLRGQAQSPEGLPLARASGALLQEYLRRTLICHVGALTREAQESLVFSLRPEATPGRWRLDFHDPQAGNSRWYRMIGLRPGR